MRKFFLLAAGCGAYATFMICYLLVLTLFLPSILSYEPSWIEGGSYAEYSVEEYNQITNNLLENGTYIWRVVSIETDANGEVIARINETYTLEWREEGYEYGWHRKIPFTGRVSDINVKDGIIGFRPLWFNRCYNLYLVDLSDFKIGNETFEGIRFEEVSVQDRSRLCLYLTRQLLGPYRTEHYGSRRILGFFLGTVTALWSMLLECF